MLTREEAIEILDYNESLGQGCPHNFQTFCAVCRDGIAELLKQLPAQPRRKPIAITSVKGNFEYKDKNGIVDIIHSIRDAVLYSDGTIYSRICGEDTWQKLPLIPQDDDND